jgi:hypothetical protein
MSFTTNGGFKSTTITGRSLAQQRRGWTALQAARKCAEAIEGTRKLVDLTDKMMIGAFDANADYVYRMLRLSHEQRDMVDAGLLSLAQATTMPKPRQLELPLGEGSQAPTEMTDAAFLSKIKSIGIERALETVAAVEAARV